MHRALNKFWPITELRAGKEADVRQAAWHSVIQKVLTSDIRP